jgi:hypothetical protein
MGNGLQVKKFKSVKSLIVAKPNNGRRLDNNGARQVKSNKDCQFYIISRDVLSLYRAGMLTL